MFDTTYVNIICLVILVGSLVAMFRIPWGHKYEPLIGGLILMSCLIGGVSILIELYRIYT